MSAVADVRDAEPCHPQEAEDIGLDHGRLVLVRRIPERVAPEAEARVVDEDVDPAEVGHRTLDEALAALAVGDVEIEGVEPISIRKLLDAASADGDPCAGFCERMGGGCPDPARGARDDSGLAIQQARRRTLTGPGPVDRAGPT